MYLEFDCESCQKRLKVREESVGSKVRCPYCHHTQVIQAQEPVVENFDFSNVSPTGPVAGSAGSAAPKGVTKSEARKSKPAPRTREDVESGTDVDPIKSGVVGVIAFVLIYAIMYPLRFHFIGQLFWDRGWVQYAETIMATWAVAILFFKYLKLRRQNESLVFDLLPSSISPRITVDKVDQFEAHVRGLPISPQESFLVNRVLRGLEHFRVLKSSSEVGSRLATQSDIDGNAVDASYSMVKVLVWAIPILGFIGTVIGIGAAVASFAETMASAGDMGALKESFNKVTGGLGTAFDTTLLALLLSMFIMFPMTVMQKGESNLLNGVDEYCNENFLKRLSDDESASPPANAQQASLDRKTIREAIDQALVPHQAELAAWQKKLEMIGQSMTEQMTKGWKAVDEQLLQRHQSMAKQILKSVESLNEAVQATKSLQESQQAQATQITASTVEAQGQITQMLKTSSQVASDVSGKFNEQIHAMEQTAAALQSTLATLGGETIVVEAAPARGWSLFGGGRGRSGRRVTSS
ncbi:MAG: hypothetical protein C0478_09195 [Planctomyces sp.]|nr:hypothetical protein [Planctomyces sp.]